MASGLSGVVVLVLCACLAPHVFASRDSDCLSYRDLNNVYHSYKSCYSGFCCGNCLDRYCCYTSYLKLSEDQQEDCCDSYYHPHNTGHQYSSELPSTADCNTQPSSVLPGAPVPALPARTSAARIWQPAHAPCVWSSTHALNNLPGSAIHTRATSNISGSHLSHIPSQPDALQPGCVLPQPASVPSTASCHAGARGSTRQHRLPYAACIQPRIYRTQDWITDHSATISATLNMLQHLGTLHNLKCAI
ncbi:uncharacterized protein [Paralichthys olivaceus]|uniref:uncharacterized protein isoform X2 n=1 Tax=Paralichthys olivaceus TaxID=8255 RepID=UPI003752EEA1